LAFEKIYTEQELVCLLKLKDKIAFEYLYDKYAASFYGIILTNLNHNKIRHSTNSIMPNFITV
jgi:hypothetical protein